MGTPPATFGDRVKVEAERFGRACGAVSMSDALLMRTIYRRRIKPTRVYSRRLRRQIWIRPGTSDWAVMMKVLGRQEYEIPDGPRNPRLIVDAGANIGISVLWFAWRYPSALIIAVEPEPSNLDLLRRNCGDLPRVRIVPAALWSRRSALQIADPDADKWSFSVVERRSADGGTVNATTVPELLEESGRERIDVLKLDIEGAEKELFGPDCEAWLSRVGTLLIELHDGFVPGCSRAFYSAILRRPFRQEINGENIIIHFTPEQ